MKKNKLILFTSLVTLLLSSEKAMSAQLILDTFNKGVVDFELTWNNNNPQPLSKIESNLLSMGAQKYTRSSTLLLNGGQTKGNEANFRINKFDSGVLSFNNDSSIYSKMSVLYSGFTALNVSKFDYFDLNLQNNDQENSLLGFPLDTISLTLKDAQYTLLLNPTITTLNTNNNQTNQVLRFALTQSSQVNLEELISIQLDIDLPKKEHGRDITVDMVGFTTLTTPEPVPTVGLLTFGIMGIFSFLKRNKNT